VKLTKRADPDGTFTLLNSKGGEVAVGLPEGAADAQIAAEAGQTGPGGAGSGSTASDPAGIKAGGRAGDDKPRGRKSSKD
jgi:hypothetical protein